MAKKRKRLVPRGTLNGKPIYDATEPMVLKIGRPDIRGAEVKSPDNCVAARALRRQQGVVTAHVYRARTYVELADQVVRYVTPGALRDETISYDRGGNFTEDDYMLRVPKGAQKLGSDHRPSDRGGGADKTRAPRHVIEGVRPAAPSGLRHG